MKTETIQEYLARGGKITKVPTQTEYIEETKTKKTTAQGPAKIITMEEADLFHGEKTKRKSAKKTPNIDISVLPDSLRKKIASKISEQDNEEEE